jgi:zinc protease
MVMKADMQGRELQITSVKKAPNKSKQEVTMVGMAVMSSVYNGTDASMNSMGQKAPIDEKMKKDMAFEAAIISELTIKDMELSAELIGVESIEGSNAYAVEVTKPSGSKTTYYYDAESGLRVRTSETIQTPQGEMVQESDLSEYKEVDGVKFPFTITLPMGPMKMTANAESIELNTGIEDSEFAVE